MWKKYSLVFTSLVNPTTFEREEFKFRGRWEDAEKIEDFQTVYMGVDGKLFDKRHDILTGEEEVESLEKLILKKAFRPTGAYYGDSYAKELLIHKDFLNKFSIEDIEKATQEVFTNGGGLKLIYGPEQPNLYKPFYSTYISVKTLESYFKQGLAAEIHMFEEEGVESHLFLRAKSGESLGILELGEVKRMGESHFVGKEDNVMISVGGKQNEDEVIEGIVITSVYTGSEIDDYRIDSMKRMHDKSVEHEMKAMVRSIL